MVDTAFIASGGGWLYCDDSRITNTNASEVVVGAFTQLLLVLIDIPGPPCLRVILQEGQSLETLLMSTLSNRHLLLFKTHCYPVVISVLHLALFCYLTGVRIMFLKTWDTTL